MSPGREVMRGLEVLHIADLTFRHKPGVKFFERITDPGGDDGIQRAVEQPNRIIGQRGRVGDKTIGCCCANPGGQFRHRQGAIDLAHAARHGCGQ